jgi:hypothetical protein
MKIICDRHEDWDLKALYDEGMDVSWAGETIAFAEEARTLMFTLDDSMPGEAVLRTIFEDGRKLAVKLGAAFADNEIQLPLGDPLLVHAVEFLREEREVRQVAVYDGPRGSYVRVPVHEIVSG